MTAIDHCYILMMPDDCLYDIFKHLPLMDHCALRGTCTRFRTICDYLFERSIGSFQLNPEIVYGSENDVLALSDVKRIVHNFGKFITKVSIDRQLFGEHTDPFELMPVLERFCRELKNLELRRVELVPEIIDQCSGLFSNLNRLVVDHYNPTSFTFANRPLKCPFTNLESVKDLEIISCNCTEENVVREFTSLERVTLIGCFLKYEFVQELLAKSSQLKRVKVIRSFYLLEFFFGETELPRPTFFIELLNLEELCIDHSALFPPPHLPAIRKIELHFDQFLAGKIEFLSDLVAHNKIEDLHLAHDRIDDESIALLCALKTLRILKFSMTTCLDGHTCKKLASELPELSEIHINQCADTTFKEIEHFVIHSNNLKKIVLVRSEDSQQPSLTKPIVSSLLEARQRYDDKDALLIFLNDSDLLDIRSGFEWDTISKMLSSGRVIKLLPLDEEHKETIAHIYKI